MSCGALSLTQVIACTLSSGGCGPLDEKSTHPAVVELINAVTNAAAVFDGDLGKAAHAALGKEAHEVVDLHSHVAAFISAAPSLREHVEMRVLDCLRGEEKASLILDLNLDSCVRDAPHSSIQDALTEKLTPHDWNDKLMETRILSAPTCPVLELFRYREFDRPVEARTPVAVDTALVLPASSGGHKYHLRGVICGDKRHWLEFVRYGSSDWFCVDDARVSSLQGLSHARISRQASLLWLERE